MRADDSAEATQGEEKKEKKKRKRVASAWRVALTRWKMAMGSFRLSATMETAAVQREV